MKRSKPFDGVGELLLSLSEEWVEISRLKRETGLNWQTLYNRLNVLKELGLIEDKLEKAPPGRRFVRLTEKGVRARELIVELYRLLGYLA